LVIGNTGPAIQRNTTVDGFDGAFSSKILSIGANFDYLHITTSIGMYIGGHVDVEDIDFEDIVNSSTFSGNVTFSFNGSHTIEFNKGSFTLGFNVLGDSLDIYCDGSLNVYNGGNSQFTIMGEVENLKFSNIEQATGHLSLLIAGSSSRSFNADNLNCGFSVGHQLGRLKFVSTTTSASGNFGVGGTVYIYGGKSNTGLSGGIDIGGHLGGILTINTCKTDIIFEIGGTSIVDSSLTVSGGFDFNVPESTGVALDNSVSGGLQFSGHFIVSNLYLKWEGNNIQIAPEITCQYFKLAGNLSLDGSTNLNDYFNLYLEFDGEFDTTNFVVRGTSAPSQPYFKIHDMDFNGGTTFNLERKKDIYGVIDFESSRQSLIDFEMELFGVKTGAKCTLRQGTSYWDFHAKWEMNQKYLEANISHLATFDTFKFETDDANFKITNGNQFHGDLKIGWEGDLKNQPSEVVVSTQDGIHGSVGNIEIYKNEDIFTLSSMSAGWNGPSNISFEELQYDQQDNLSHAHVYFNNVSIYGSINLLNGAFVLDSTLLSLGGDFEFDIVEADLPYPQSYKEITLSSDNGLQVGSNFTIQLRSSTYDIQLSAGLNPGDLKIIKETTSSYKSTRLETISGLQGYIPHLNINDEAVLEVDFDIEPGSSFEMQTKTQGDHWDLDLFFNGHCEITKFKETKNGEIRELTLDVFNGNNAHITVNNHPTYGDYTFACTGDGQLGAFTYDGPRVSIDGSLLEIDGDVELEIDHRDLTVGAGYFRWKSQNGFYGFFGLETIIFKSVNIDVNLYGEANLNPTNGDWYYLDYDLFGNAPTTPDNWRLAQVDIPGSDTNPGVQNFTFKCLINGKGMKISGQNVWTEGGYKGDTYYDHFIRIWWPLPRWTVGSIHGTNPQIFTTDNDGATWTQRWPLGNQAPVADAGGPYDGNANTPITFNGGGSYDPDEDNLEYQWDFGDGQSSSWSTDSTATHTYTNDGDYTVTLTVREEDTLLHKTDTDTADVNIGSGINIDITYDGDELNEGETFTVHVTQDGQPVGNELVVYQSYDPGDPDPIFESSDYTDSNGYVDFVAHEVLPDNPSHYNDCLVIVLGVQEYFMVYDTTGRVYGYVKDSDDHAGIGGAQVVATDEGTGAQYSTTTRVASPIGFYDLYLPPGTYDIVYSKSGYYDNYKNNVVVESYDTNKNLGDIYLDRIVTKPTVVTQPASSVTSTSAVLNGRLDDLGGEACQVWFEYGTTTSYGHSTSQETKSSTGTFNKLVSSLSSTTTYHFRACASNSYGTSYGDDETFVTTTCFLAGTKITMADGTYKNIEEIKPGDIVKAYHEETGQIKNAKVLQVFHHKKEQAGSYYLLINEKLKVTPNHPIFVNNKWITAEDIKIGDKLLKINTEPCIVFSIEKIYEKEPTYNLEVETYHTYYAEDVLVHNKATPGWVRPSGHQGTTGWNDEGKAHDSSTSSYAYYSKIGDTGTCDYSLILTYSSPVACNKMRIDAKSGDHLRYMSVKLYQGNTLKETCFFTSWPHHSYIEDTFSTTIVDKIDITFTLESGYGFGTHWAKVYDFQLYRV
jgi:hypothetical protein